jgi:hypothetical protein
MGVIEVFIVQETDADKFSEIAVGASILKDDVLHPWQITELWSAAELQAIGVYRVEPAPAPNPAIAVKGYSFQRNGDTVVQILDLDIPGENTPVEITCTARQLRLAMNELGLRADIEEYVKSQPMDTQDMWNYTPVFYSSHPFVIGAMEQMNKTDADRIALFSLALTMA